MARPARHTAEVDEPPLHDPASVEHAYHYHRRRRAARREQQREHRLARMRFWFLSAFLVLLTLVLAVTIWDRVESLFGL